MDSWEFNKLAGAVLAAALAIVLPKTLIDLSAQNASHGHGGDHAGYTLPMPEATGKPGKAGDKAAPAGEKLAAVGSAPAAAAAGNIFDTVKPLLTKAKAENGAASFKACAACHSAEKGGANKVGPAMWGVVGRKKGAVDGFNYSAALKGHGGEWNYETLAGFIQNPKGYLAGTKMVYAGLNDPEKLADLLAYLGTLSDSPVPLPK